MKKWITILALIMLLVPFQTLASDDRVGRLEQQVLELYERVKALESRYTQELASEGSFFGQGNSQTTPFTVSQSPWKLSWQLETTMPTAFGIAVYKFPSKVEVGYGAINTFCHGEGIWNGETICYLPAGMYYIQVGTGSYVSWSIEVSG